MTVAGWASMQAASPAGAAARPLTHQRPSCAVGAPAAAQPGGTQPSASRPRAVPAGPAAPPPRSRTARPGAVARRRRRARRPGGRRHKPSTSVRRQIKCDLCGALLANMRMVGRCSITRGASTRWCLLSHCIAAARTWRAEHRRVLLQWPWGVARSGRYGALDVSQGARIARSLSFIEMCAASSHSGFTSEVADIAFAQSGITWEF